MGNFTSCITTSDEEPSASAPTASAPTASAPTALPPKVLIDNKYQEWVKIQDHLEQWCLGREEITEKQLAHWTYLYIETKNLFEQHNIYFPFKEVALRVLQIKQFFFLRDKKKEGVITEKEKVSLRKITLELHNVINEVKESYYETELALMELEI